MKRVFAASVIAAALASTPAFAQTFSTTLKGANEVPAADPDGIGFAVVDLSGTTVTYSILTHGIATPTVAHIHRGPVGVSGAIVVDLLATFTNGVATGTVTGDASTLDEIRANPTNFYLNVHNADFQSGALRGQLGLPLGTNVYFLPTVVKSAGLNGTQFVSNLSIFNPGGTSATVQLEFFQRNDGGLSGPTATQTVTVAAGGSVQLNDLPTRFSVSGSFAGALRITSDQPIIISHRVLNDLRHGANGTCSLVVPSATIGSAVSSGFLGPLSTATDDDLVAGRGFRTNIGWFNPNPFPVTITFTARTPNGTSLGSRTIVVPAFAQEQLPAVLLFDNVSTSDLARTDYSVRYDVQGGGLFVYATVVDNTTGDGVYILGSSMIE